MALAARVRELESWQKSRSQRLKGLSVQQAPEGVLLAPLRLPGHPELLALHAGLEERVEARAPHRLQRLLAEVLREGRRLDQIL